MASRHVPSGPLFCPTTEKPSDDKVEFKSFDSENNQAAIQKILLMKAETCEEKFIVLDARDKLYKLMQYKYPSPKRGALLATCPDMCPEKERLLREFQNRGSMFEMTNFSKNSGFNHSLAVKEYARSSADQEEPLPHELRPIHVLTKTMNHLLHNVVDFCELSDDNLEEWYMFMWDRTRALRKELTQQGLCSVESVTLVEQCARFHIHCAERLIDQDSSIYDDKINTENLTKCLQTLKYMYKDLAKEDIKCPNEPEFLCYTLLLNLNNSSVFIELSNMSDSLMASDAIKFALDVMTTWETRNYIRFFNLVKKTSYLNCCLLRRYFREMRLYAVKTMIRSYCTKNYSPQIPVSRFVENLNFEGEEECLEFLSQCNFNFCNVDGTTVVNFNRLLFQNPESTLTMSRAFIFIEEKKKTPLSSVLAGGELPPNSNENYAPENSFNEKGELKESALRKLDLMDIDCLSSPTNTISGLSDIKGRKSTNKSQNPTLSLDVYEKEERRNFNSDEESDKKVEVFPLPSAPFSSQESTAPSKNVFLSDFNKTEIPNVFDGNFQSRTGKLFEETSRKNPFFASTALGTLGNKETALPQTDSVTLFGAENKKSFSDFTFNKVSSQERNVKRPEKNETSECVNSNVFGQRPVFQFKLEPPIKKASEDQNGVNNMQKHKHEVMERPLRQKEEEKEKNENRKRKISEEEEDEKIVLERKMLAEENHMKEIERKEKEKREKEEILKKEEQARIEANERKMLEKIEKEEKRKQAEARLKRLDEEKRKLELEHRKKVDQKMRDLKTKWEMWKTKLVFDKWRMRTWSITEERKMKKYFRETKKKYPPVCSEELLESNPYGLIIPNILIFENFHYWGRDFHDEPSRKKKLFLVSDELPLIKLNSIVGKSLEARAKSLGCRLDPFLWKLVISLPDELESPQFWKSIETFVEMHFVDDVGWEFGRQKGPLYCRNSTYRSFKFNICVRRARGRELYEGSEPNPLVGEGCNAIIFVLVGNGNNITAERLKAVIKSKPPLPKIPVVLFNFADGLEDSILLKNSLDLETLQKTHITESHVISAVQGKHHLVNRLIECLDLTARISSSPSSLRICLLSDFFSETRLDSLWQRISISLSNFKVVLVEPTLLIEFYNSCIEEIIDIFLDDSHNEKSVVTHESSDSKLNRPEKTISYVEKIKSLLNLLKLPQWPAETPKSSHQLNYRIHQYCKKIVGNDRLKMKNIKWLLYRIIRRSLLWKGLDIYCDEDIREILIHFPWIQIFQEIFRIKTQQFNDHVKREENSIVVVYDLERVENFSFETSLISKLMKNSKKSFKSFKRVSNSFQEVESEESGPCLENDSIIYAFSAALERRSNKRKQEELVEDSLDALFSGSLGKRIATEEDEEEGTTTNFDFSSIDISFQNLSDRLDQLKKKSIENKSALLDIRQKLK